MADADEVLEQGEDEAAASQSNQAAGVTTHEIGEEEMLDIAEQIFNMIA